MDPPICRADSLAVPERLAGIYCSSEPSKYDSVLVLWGSCSRPWWSGNADNSFGWAQMELIVTGYRSMKLLVRMMPEFRKETEIWRPNSWLGLSGGKPPLTAAPCLCNNLYPVRYNWWMKWRTSGEPVWLTRNKTRTDVSLPKSC